MSKKVSLFITTTDADESFLSINFSNLIINSQFSFSEIILITDRIKKAFVNQKAEEYLDNGLITSVFEADYSKFRTITEKYSSSFYNYKGNYAYLYGIEKCTGDFILHYDIDMLLYTLQGFSWVKEGIELLEKYDDLFAVHPSPPLNYETEKLKSDMESLMKNNCIFDRERGYRKYKDFSTRCFLVRRDIKDLTGLYVDDVLEDAVSEKLREEKKHRGEIINPDKYFIIHSHNKWINDRETLQKITRLINSGLYPASQLDKYDLDIFSYKELLKE